MIKVETVEHCQQYHSVDPVLIVFVLVTYFAYAFQIFYYQRKVKKIDYKVGVVLWSPIFVFVMCGLAHASQLLPLTQEYWIGRNIWYLALGLVALAMVGFNAAKIQVEKIYAE